MLYAAMAWFLVRLGLGIQKPPLTCSDAVMPTACDVNSGQLNIGGTWGEWTPPTSVAIEL